MAITANTQVTVRRAHGEDFGLLAELGERTFAETFASHNTSEDMTATSKLPSMLRSRLRSWRMVKPPS